MKSSFPNRRLQVVPLEERACPAILSASDVPALITAINTALTNNEDDTIQLTGTAYAFQTANNPNDGGNALPVVTNSNGRSLTINGNGATLSVGIQADLMRFFEVDGGQLTLANMTLTGGRPEFADGGAVLVRAGNFEARSVLFRNNSTEFNGGAVAFWNNTTNGFLANCTFTENVANASNETFGPQGGGAIFVDMGEPPNPEATITVRNCTIIGNSAGFIGQEFGDVRGGGLLLVNGGNVQIENTIIANNTAGTEPDDVYQDSFLNDQTNTTTFAGDIGARNSLIRANLNSVNGGQIALLPVGTDPLLGALANNGGLSHTFALASNSPCVNAGDNAFSPGTTDQRGTGFPRVRGGTIDMGAYETQPRVARVSLVQSSMTTRVKQLVRFVMTVRQDNGEAPVPTGSVRFFDNNRLIAVVPLDNQGRATLPTTALVLGGHTIRAVYTGDVNYDTTTRAVVHTVVGAVIGRRWAR